MASSTSVSSCCHFVLCFLYAFVFQRLCHAKCSYILCSLCCLRLLSHLFAFVSAVLQEPKIEWEQIGRKCNLHMLSSGCKSRFACGFSFWFINFDRYACNSLSIESVDWPQLSNKLLRRWQRFFLFIDGANFIVDFVQSNKKNYSGLG